MAKGKRSANSQKPYPLSEKSFQTLWMSLGISTNLYGDVMLR